MSKAMVFIWPLLSEEEQGERELECVNAGYENKTQRTISGHDIWIVT